jgi:hypothetical protein
MRRFDPFRSGVSLGEFVTIQAVIITVFTLRSQGENCLNPSKQTARRQSGCEPGVGDDSPENSTMETDATLQGPHHQRPIASLRGVIRTVQKGPRESAVGDRPRGFRVEFGIFAQSVQ